MKLYRSAERSIPRVRSSAVLGSEAAPDTAIFDIRRDVKSRDWQRIAERITRELGYANPDVEAEITQLVVLDTANESGLDMETVRAAGCKLAKRNFREKLSRQSIGVHSAAEPLVHWLILEPAVKQTLLTGELESELKNRLWNQFKENFRFLNSSLEVPLALFLLFPEQQERIRQTCGWPAVKKSLEHNLNWNLRTPAAYQAVLLAQLLYPEQARKLMTTDLVRKEIPMGDLKQISFFNLNAFATFDLLSAERVWLDEQGKIQIERQKPVVPRTQELPPRKLV